MRSEITHRVKALAKTIERVVDDLGDQAAAALDAACVERARHQHAAKRQFLTVLVEQRAGHCRGAARIGFLGVARQGSVYQRRADVDVAGQKKPPRLGRGILVAWRFAAQPIQPRVWLFAIDWIEFAEFEALGQGLRNGAPNILHGASPESHRGPDARCANGTLPSCHMQREGT
jgi:hypothetical protein